MRRKNNYAQSFLEYSLIIIVVAAALLATRMYLVRSVQAKYRQAGDVFGAGEQYVKGATHVTESGSYFTPLFPGKVDPDTCENIRARREALEAEINTTDYDYTDANGQVHHVHGLRGQAADLIARAAEIEAQVKLLPKQQAVLLLKVAQDLRNKAKVILTQEIPAREAKIAAYRQFETDNDCP